MEYLGLSSYSCLLLTALSASMIGIIAYFANCRRRVNIVFLTTSLHVTLWLILRYINATHNSLIIFRVAVCVGSLWFLHLLIASQLILRPKASLWCILIRKRLWVVLSLFEAALPTTTYFVPAEATRENALLGPAYYLYIVVAVLSYIYLFFSDREETHLLNALQKLELAIFTKGGAISGIALAALMGLRAVSRIQISAQSVVIPLLFYAWAIYCVTNRRILDARQMFLAFLSRLLFILVIVGSSMLTFFALKRFGLPNDVLYVTVLALSSIGSALLNPKWERLFCLAPEISAVRLEVQDVSRREIQPERLTAAFQEILLRWLSASHVCVYWGSPAAIQQVNGTAKLEAPLVDVLRRLRWVTPELLQRARPSGETKVLHGFIERHQFKVVVLVEGVEDLMCIGVGSSVVGSYTYPYVQQILEIASTMANNVERSHYFYRAQQAERLAMIGMVGANITHEIRSPLLTVKTFIALLEHDDSPELRSRFLGPIRSELARLDNLTEQFLDLSRPRAYKFAKASLRDLVAEAQLLLEGEAAERQIYVTSEFELGSDAIWTDYDAAMQIFINLYRNSIQALEDFDGRRCIAISTHRRGNCAELRITDSGPGILPAVRATLFQPFYTTKKKGCGLGLAICRGIVADLNGTISFCADSDGSGASFRVLFPCQKC